jgi:hypothetical protein
MTDRKPPPLPPLKERLRKPVRELAIGSPTISVELYMHIASVNDAAIRRFVTTFPRPGKQWGDPDVTAMRIMFGAALEAAVTKALESVTAVTLPADIPRDNSVGPFPDDETTVPMGRHQKPHG